MSVEKSNMKTKLKSTQSTVCKRMDRETTYRHTFLATQSYLDFICAHLALSQICRQSESQIICLLLSFSSSSSLSLSPAHFHMHNRTRETRPLPAHCQSPLKITNRSAVFHLYSISAQHLHGAVWHHVTVLAGHCAVRGSVRLCRFTKYLIRQKVVKYQEVL